jgi:hypothetical protein
MMTSYDGGAGFVTTGGLNHEEREGRDVFFDPSCRSWFTLVTPAE